MIALALLLAAPAAASTALSTEQRDAADRLLIATGAPARREAQIDEIVGRLVVFTSRSCAAVAGDRRQATACAARNRTGRDILARIGAAKPELIAAITAIQEQAYASRLSVAEMEAVTAFAATPGGRHFFEAAQPTAMEAANAVDLLIIKRFQRVLDQLEAEQPQPDTVMDPAR